MNYYKASSYGEILEAKNGKIVRDDKTLTVNDNGKVKQWVYKLPIKRQRKTAALRKRKNHRRTRRRRVSTS